ncbi:MAG: hypothetical protein QOE66_2423, partial [Chloroflexota bacterium]|nr:hypothetical protein [Chloroflexota bacterium]
MALTFACPQCGHNYRAEWGQVGREFHCSLCRTSMVVPAPAEPLSPPPERPAGGSVTPMVVPPQVEPISPPPAGPAGGSVSFLRFACPGCGRRFATKPRLAGRPIRCGGCGAGVRIPGPDGEPVVPPAAAAVPASPRPVPAPKTIRAPRPAVTASEDDLEILPDDELVDYELDEPLPARVYESGPRSEPAGTGPPIRAGKKR